MSSEFIQRRRNPLSGDYVLVSPHRNNRPWKGAVEKSGEAKLPPHVDDCPLCAGNTRANGESNPDYAYTHVFTNDFAALNMEEYAGDTPAADDLFAMEKISGTSRVMCFSPKHNLSLPELSEEELSKVIETWVEQYSALAGKFNWVQIFENKGAIMGCSQPHPHGQIWAHDFLPSIPAREEENQLAYYKKHGSNMLVDYAAREIEAKARIVVETEHWLAVVPYWAAWPFETLLLPKAPTPRMSDLTKSQQHDLAPALKELTTRYDNVFQCSFPYSMGWHGAPTNIDHADHWQLHAHFSPPLLRSATVKKHMVGYEMMAESQRDLTAEKAAEILQNTSTTHYKSAE